jgi:sulfotransferase family protein
MANPLQIGRSQLGRARRSGEHALRRADARRRPLPDFVIVGAQKAGTTSLHDYLCQHPSVSQPATKEVHFFDLAYGRGAGWYRAHFRPGRPGQISGESTPYYLFHPAVPGRLQETLPEAKLIVLLRDPVDRAFSHHNHERALGYEHLEFEAALAAEAERLAGEEERLLADPGYRSRAHQHFSYLARGNYAEQLERWFEHCGEERFLVLSAEDLFGDPAAVVAVAQEFLELPRQIPVDLSAKNARSYAPIPEPLRERLREHFAPANERLRALLGRDLGWD